MTEYKYVHISEEDEGIHITLPSGETVTVTFNGSDPVVYLWSFDSDTGIELVPA